MVVMSKPMARRLGMIRRMERQHRRDLREAKINRWRDRVNSLIERARQEHELPELMAALEDMVRQIRDAEGEV